MSKRLAIISTHPIQYYAPVFQLLQDQVELKVFYSGGESLIAKFDHGFKKKIEWDIPLLQGYAFEFLINTAKEVGSHHFKGVKTPTGIEQINKFKPDAILVYGWAYESHLAILKYFKGKIPVYFRGDSTVLNRKTGLKSYLKKLYLKNIYTNVDAAFYVGTANKAYYEYCGLKSNQLIFAPHAIDNQRFSSDRATDALAIRESLGLTPDDLLILFAGKFEKVKNPLLLLSAFNEIETQRIHLLFVGNGSLEKELKKVSQQHPKNDHVHFMGFQNQTQMPAIYQACDLFCLPSISETWGLAVNEAMASGKPVLVSDKVGCAIDLVTEKTGNIFKSGSLYDLKQNLIALTKDKSALQKMGNFASVHIHNWSFENQVKAIADYVKR
jgi:glycosyltransferase involved in cell wall biosynthesis